MTSINLTNVARPEHADPLVHLLTGASYMELQVHVYPVGGSFNVDVSTLRPKTSKGELLEMVKNLLCDHVRKFPPTCPGA